MQSQLDVTAMILEDSQLAYEDCASVGGGTEVILVDLQNRLHVRYPNMPLCVV